MGVGVRVDGLRETVTAMKRAGVEVNDLKDAFASVGSEVVKVSQAHTPTRSGKLKTSVRASRRQNGVIISVGGARAPYAPFVMFGSKHNPRPINMVARALDYVDIEGVTADALSEALRRAGL